MPTRTSFNPLILLLVPIMLAPPSARAAIGEWRGDENAKARLVAAEVDAEGHLSAGIEIALEPGWKTYWRTPGDAGIPPRTDFSASSNIGAVEIAYPPPERLDDGYGATNVYHGRVVLPVSVEIADPSRPVDLVLGLDIGVCDKICVPAHFDLSVDIPKGASDAEAAAILTEAKAALPTDPVPGEIAVERVDRTGGDDRRPVYEMSIVAPGAAGAEIFVEGPADWSASPPRLIAADNDQATYKVEFSRLGATTPIGGNSFRVTIVSAGQAVEQIVTPDSR